jgi:cardiolipin synthase A/B
VKALVVDDWVCVGSANFDGLSLRINEEINIAFTDKTSANELVEDLFETDVRKSTRLYEIKVSEKDKSWLEPLTDQL